MRFKMYRDKMHLWRWSLVASNGRIIADSAESYHNRKDMEKIIKKIRLYSLFSKMEEVEPWEIQKWQRFS